MNDAERLARLRRNGVIDLHFDLPMDLYEKRWRRRILEEDFYSELQRGDIRLFAAAVYLEDKYLPGQALTVALGQVAKLHQEVAEDDRFAFCRSFAEIENARTQEKIGVLLALEGVEPLGEDLGLLRIFYELGLRLVGFTHRRVNAAASGAVFSTAGSPAEGLTDFGRALLRECERLGLIIDLAHINPAGFDEIIALTERPPIVSHSNARKFFDLERNLSDEQIVAVARKGGVIGVNSVLVSPEREKATLDHYVDHFTHFIALAGIDHVAIGFDFFDFIYRQWSEEKKTEFHEKFPRLHTIPGLAHHGHAPNLIRKFIDRGFRDDEIEKILNGNWLRVLRQLL